MSTPWAPPPRPSAMGRTAATARPPLATVWAIDPNDKQLTSWTLRGYLQPVGPDQIVVHELTTGRAIPIRMGNLVFIAYDEPPPPGYPPPGPYKWGRPVGAGAAGRYPTGRPYGDARQAPTGRQPQPQPGIYPQAPPPTAGIYPQAPPPAAGAYPQAPPPMPSTAPTGPPQPTMRPQRPLVEPVRWSVPEAPGHPTGRPGPEVTREPAPAAAPPAAAPGAQAPAAEAPPPETPPAEAPPAEPPAPAPGDIPGETPADDRRWPPHGRAEPEPEE